MAFSFTRYKDELLFIPLGGSNEIGMNLNLYRYKGRWLMVDLGIGFASDWLPGVDIVVPDIQFVREEVVGKLDGVVITHAHEDHIGAMPYLWDELKCPIYATPFALSVLKRKFAEHGIQGAKMIPIAAGDTRQVGPFDLEMVHITHSIPEMNAIAIRTDKGTVLHTGDWKFDEEPLVGPASDYSRLKELGDSGEVLAMVGDSTNVFVEGESGSESMVRTNLIRAVSEFDNRIAVTTFASNVARLESIVMAARENGRKVALAGRSLSRITEAAQENGYLKGETFLTDKQGMKEPRGKVLFICTGCQGEPRAAIPRIARGDHPVIQFIPGDAVIFSSRVIPGNEMTINRLNNNLLKSGIETYTERDHSIHVSGHPARDELRRMYELVRPKIAVPVHGEARHLHEQAKFARHLGVPEALEGENGAVILLKPGGAAIVGQVHSGYMAVDGKSIIPSDSPIIKTRRRLRDDGSLFISLVVDSELQLLGEAQVSAPGLLDPKQDQDLLQEIQALVAEVSGQKSTRKSGSQKMEEGLRGAVRRFMRQELGKQPVVSVHLFRLEDKS